MKNPSIRNLGHWGACLLMVLGVGIQTSVGAEPGPGTKAMAERLQTLSNQTQPMGNAFANRKRADFLESGLRQLEQQPQTGQTILKIYQVRTQLAQEWIKAGPAEKAIEQLDAIEALLRKINQLGAEQEAWLAFQRGMAFLRIGELENCLANHTIESCLFPIQGAGIHRLPKGSSNALPYFSKLLEKNPKDLRSRWLLNIAHMTLGTYPDGISEQWRLPSKALESSFDIKKFPDVSSVLDLDLDGNAGGVIMDDFNQDGYLDLMISAWGLTDQIRYFQNNQNGTFSDRTKEAALTGVYGGLNLVQADYDNDGDLDFLMLRGAWLGRSGHHPNSLVRNNGDGTFEDVTEAAGLLSFHPTQTAVWFDYNADGWLDLFIGNESTPKDTHPCELYLNNKDGTFTECASTSGLQLSAFVKTVACGDYNNDGRPDLYLACRGGRNWLYRNDGPTDSDKDPTRWKFTEVAEMAGVTEPTHAFPAWFFDYDNDGWLDIFAAGYAVRDVGDVAADVLGLPTPAERARLFRNNRDGTFTDATKEANLYQILLAMPGNFGDLDNDGYLDIYLGTGDPNMSTLIPNKMFRNHLGKSFQDVTTSGGFGHLQKGHGISLGDLDNDGDQDVYSVMGGAYDGDTYRNVLFANPGHGNHWITLQLQGGKSNRSALGARIRVVVEELTGKERSIYKSVSTGASFGGSPLRQEIGLGRATNIIRVEIQWPTTGKTQVLENLLPNRFYKVIEEENKAIPVTLKSFSLTDLKSKGHHHHKH